MKYLTIALIFLFCLVSYGDNEDYMKHFSSWNGANRKLVQVVKAEMKDPSSFKHIHSTITSETSTLYCVLMTYYGKNSFNAVVKSEVQAIIRRNNGEIIMIQY